MPLYNYRVIDGAGLQQRGKHRADSIREAADYLRKRRNTIIYLKEEGGFFAIKEKISRGRERKIKSRDLMLFCCQFASMTNAGLNIIKGLNILKDQAENTLLKEGIRQITQMVESGGTLAASMEKMPRVFPPVMTGMVAAGESGGMLGEVLERLAAHYQRQSDLEEKIRSAMVYPAIISVVALIVLGIMIFFILPAFGNMFLNLGAELPFLTALVFSLGEFVVRYRLLILLSFPLAFILLRLYLRSENGRNRYEQIILHIPVFSPLYRKTLLARFARNLSSLLKSGVQILESIKLVEELLHNRAFRREMTILREKIGDGESMAVSLEGRALFPAMMVEMIRSGEETGNLDIMLNRAADLYEGEVTYSVERLSAIIEPAVLVFVGLFVGILVLSLVLPMFMIYQNI